MKWLTLRAVSVLILLFAACDDSGMGSAANDILIDSVSASITANLEPPVSSNPVSCQVQVVLSNKSSSMYWRLGFPSGEVFLSSTGEKLGVVRFATPWDGVLLPGERKSISLRNADSTAAMVRVTCGESVFLKLSLYQTNNRLTEVAAPQSPFQCYH